MSELQSLSAFDGVSAAGRYGNPNGTAGVTLTERANLGLATLEVRKGQTAALAEKVQAMYGAALPVGPVSASGTGVRFIGIAPGQWFAVSETMPNEALAVDLATKLQGLASVADHSSGRMVMRLEGPAVRDVLAKGLAVDIDPSVFIDGAAALTNIGHIGVLVWRDDEAFDLTVFRSFAGSFYDWLQASAAEFGIDVVT
ncbi:MAG: sarcosine oxidase subunit gamma family protein [Pseudomonadota bacterium]